MFEAQLGVLSPSAAPPLSQLLPPTTIHDNDDIDHDDDIDDDNDDIDDDNEDIDDDNEEIQHCGSWARWRQWSEAKIKDNGQKTAPGRIAHDDDDYDDDGDYDDDYDHDDNNDDDGDNDDIKVN